MDIAVLKQQLAPLTKEICFELFPNGKIDGTNYRVGGIGGEKGQSLSVQMRGENAGQWKDFATGDAGDLLDLIGSVMNLNMRDVMSWAQKRYGIRDDIPKTLRPPKPTNEKQWTTPTLPNQSNTGSLHKFLESRGFPSEDLGDICFKYKLRETQDVWKGKSQGNTDIVFPLINSEGELQYLKSKPIDYNGHPGACGVTGMKACLFGWQGLDPNARTLWITEGEMDCIAADYLGFPSLSMPNGASVSTNENADDWIQYEWDNLSRFEEIVIATDTDEAGEVAAKKLMKRLGEEKCLRVTFPAKDINDLLKDNGRDRAKNILEESYNGAKWTDPDQLQNVANFGRELNDYFSETDDESNGFATGFKKLDEEDFRCRAGELIVVTGPNGSGKSMLTDFVGMNSTKQGKKILIASMEMKPVMTLSRMVQQYTAKSRDHLKNNPETVQDTLEDLSENCWLYVDTLTPDIDRLLEVCEYGFKRYGIEVFIIDSLTNLSGQMDYEKQQEAMEKFVTFKLNFNCTVFMVTHSRKGESEHKAMDKYDVKGSGAITDLADSVLSVWKNKKKADHIEECHQQGMPTDPDITGKPDIVLQVLKNRHGLYEGKCGLWFDKSTCQYLEGSEAVPMPFTTNREEPF